MWSIANISTLANHGLVVGQNRGCINYTNVQPDQEKEKQKVLEEKIQKCCDAILITDPAVDREITKSLKGERVAGTCEWIRKNSTFKQCILPDSKTHSLWLRGGPGMVKTILSTFLTEDLERSFVDQDKLQTFFFCDHQDCNRSSAVGILRGIIWQIIKAKPSLHVHVLYCANNDKQTKHSLNSREALWLMFERILRDEELGEVICIIYGLAECDQDSITWLAGKIGHAVHEIQPECKHPPKFFIASRPEVAGLQMLKKMDLAGEVSIIHNNVKIFITAKIQRLNLILGFDDELRERVKTTSLERSEGSFLWLGCIIAELELKPTCTEVQEALNKFPKQLDALYNRFLKQISHDHKADCLRIFQWVTKARTPLSLAELGEALQSEPHLGLSKERSVRDRIVWCKSLVTVQENIDDSILSTVSLIHYSFEQHLLSLVNSTDISLQYFRIIEDELHLLMARHCLDYFKKSLGEKLFWDCHDPVDNRLRPLMKYAILYWGQHARCAGSQALQLLESHYEDIKEGPLICKYWAWSYRKAEDSTTDMRTLVERENSVPHLIVAAKFGISPWIQKHLAELYDKADSRRFVLDLKEHGGRYTALHYACQAGHQDTVELILNLGAMLDDLSVFIVVEEGQFECLKTSLAHGDNPNAKSFGLFAPAALHEATAGSIDVVNLLLDAGANANFKVGGLVPPLRVALEMGSLEVVEALFPRMVFNQHEHELEYYICLAIEAQRLEIIRYLCIQKRRLEPHAIRQSLFLREAFKSRCDTTIATVLDCLQIDIETRFGCQKDCPSKTHSAVGYALQMHTPQIWSVLVDRGAILKDEHGNDATTQAFMCAAVHGCTRLLNQILEKGFSIDTIQGPLGHTALHLAVEEKCYVSAGFLVARKANVNCKLEKEREGEIPLMTAASNGDADMVQLLLDNGANPSLRDLHGRTALRHAINKGHNSMVEIWRQHVSKHVQKQASS